MYLQSDGRINIPRGRSSRATERVLLLPGLDRRERHGRPRLDSKRVKKSQLAGTQWQLRVACAFPASWTWVGADGQRSAAPDDCSTGTKLQAPLLTEEEREEGSNCCRRPRPLRPGLIAARLCGRAIPEPPSGAEPCCIEAEGSATVAAESSDTELETEHKTAQRSAKEGSVCGGARSAVPRRRWARLEDAGACVRER